MATRYAIPSQDGAYIAGFFDADKDQNPAELYGATATAGWRKLTATQAEKAKHGYDFATLKPMAEKPATIGELLQHAWMLREIKEQTVLDINGMSVRAGKDTADRLTAILAYLARHSDEQVDFSHAEGTVKLGATEIGIIADVVGAHTQKVFSVYALAVAGINDGSIKTRAQIEALSWA